MALARTNLLGSITTSINTASPVASGSFTPPNNSLLVVAIMVMEYTGSTDPLADLTVAGGGLTFTERVSKWSGGNWGASIKIWTAPVTTGTSMTLTADCGARSVAIYGFTAVAYTGYDTGSPTGVTGTSNNSNGGDGPQSLTLSGAPATTSEVFAGIALDKESLGCTPGSTFTELYDLQDSTGGGMETQVRTGSASTTVDWVDTHTGGAAFWSFAAAAVEIKAALSTDVSRVAVTTGAPGAATAFSPTLPTHAAGDRLVLAVVGKYDTTTVPTINQGWTLVKSGTGGTGSTGQDSGITFWAIYAKDATSGSETAPTVTPGATAPNSWEWICVTHRLGSGKSWRDTIAASAAWVQSASDTNTAQPLAGTAGAWTGVQPTTGDAIFAVGVIPTDLGTALTTGSSLVTISGLSGGTKDLTSTNYIENALGFDTAAVWLGWVGFTGTATTGLNPTFTVTGATNQSGSIIAIALRETTAGPPSVTLTPANAVSSARALDLPLPEPIAAYHFDEGSGLVANDVMGGNYDLTVGHTTNGWNASGKTNSALHNTGASGGATGAVGPSGSKTNWTIMLWMRREGSPSGWTSPFGETAGNWYIEMQNPSYDIAFWGNNTAQSTSTPATLDTWFHVAVVRSSGTGQTQMYLNGVATGPAVTNAAHTFSASHSVAATPQDEVTWDGSVDDLRIFDVALDAAQIQSLMSIPVPSGVSPGAVTITPAAVASSAVVPVYTPTAVLSTATVASSARPLTLTPIVVLSPAVVNDVPVALTIQPKITLTAASVASSAIALTITPVINLAAVSTVTSAIALTITPVVSLTPATAASSAVALSLSLPAGAATITPAIVASSAVAIDPDRIVTISPAVVVSSAVAPVYTPYAVLTPAVAATSAVAVDPDRIVTITPASVISSAVAIDPATNVTISPATAASSAVGVAPEGPDFATLVEPFDSSNTAVWDYGTGATVSGGVLTLTPNSSTTSTDRYYNLTDSEVLTEISSVAGGANPHYLFMAQYDSLRYFAFVYLPATNRIEMKYRIDATQSVPSVVYSATNHRWLRISHSGGNILWDASPDSTNWTNLRTVSYATLSAIPLTTLQVRMQSVTGTGSTVYENINVPIPAVSLTPAVAASSAVAVDPDKIVTISPATVVSSARTLTYSGSVTLTPAAVTSSAVAVDPDAVIAISSAVTASSAVAVSVSAIVQLAPASAASSAVAPVYTPVVFLTPATTTSIARLLTLSGTAISAPAVVASSARVLTLTPVVTLTPAVVASSAIAPVYTSNVNLTPATFIAAPVALTLVRTVILTPAVASSSAVAVGAGGVGAATIAPAVVASSAIAPVYTPVVSLTPAVVAASAGAQDPTGVITIAAAVVASSAGAQDPTAIITISPAAMFVNAEPVDPTANIFIAPAVVASSAPAQVVTPVVQLAVVSVATSARTLSYTPYAVLTAAVANSSARTLVYSGSVTLTPAVVASSAVAPVYTPYAVLTPATVAVVAQVLSYSAFGTLSLTTASVSASARPLVLVQTVIVTRAVTASSAVALSPTGVGAVTLTPAVIASSAVAPTVTPVISLTAASTASVAVTLAPIPVVALTPATAASSARQLTLTPVVSLTPAVAASSARPLTLVQIVVLTPALASAVAAVLSYGGIGSISLIPASLASSALAQTITPVVQLNAGGVASSAIAVTLIPGIDLSPATTSLSVPAVVFVPVVQLSAAGATFTAIPVSVSHAVTLTAAGVTVSATVLSFPGDRSPGKTFVVLSGAEVPLLFKAVKGGVLVDSGWLAVSS